jgi:hypothetical protein
MAESIPTATRTLRQRVTYRRVQVFAAADPDGRDLNAIWRDSWPATERKLARTL